MVKSKLKDIDLSIEDPLDINGAEPNFLNNKNYSSEYIELAKSWSKLPLYQNKDQIENFIQRWHDLAFQNREDKSVKQKRLQKAITESKAIRELAGNPLLLTMMAVLNRTQELPRDRPKLYERASEVLLHQ